MKNTSFEQELKKAWEKYVEEERNKKYPNIMLLGVTGAGKSSLVNLVFDIDIAKTSNVEPETKGYCNFYDGHKYGKTVNLIDTAGYEIDQSDIYLDNVIKAVNSKYDGEPVHVLWYCFSLGNERIEEIDIRVIKSLLENKNIKERLCVVFTHCDLDDYERTKTKAFKKVLLNNGLNNLPTFETSTSSDFKIQLSELIQWSSEQLNDEDFRQSFIGSQMADLELKRKEASRIINNACLSIGAIRLSEMLMQNDKKKDLAEHQMKMVTTIFSVYGIDCLAGLTKKFEKTTSLVDFGNSLVSIIIGVIPKLDKLQEYIKTATATGLTRVVGDAASKISYSYVEKHIKGIPVKFEEFYTDPNFAGSIITLLNDAMSSASTIIQEKNNNKTDCDKQNNSKKESKKK